MGEPATEKGDVMKHPRMERKRWIVALTAVVAMGVLGAATAGAQQSFLDVPEDHLFHGDIEWMKETGVTRGCNPPANTNYCPEDFTTRGEMAAFFHRFSDSGVINAGTLDGKDSTEFVLKTEIEELGGVPGPQGPPGDPAEFSTDNITIREAGEGTGLVVLGTSYTALCEPGEVAIGGGYEAEFTLLDAAGLDLPVVGDLPLVGDVVGLLSVDSGTLDSLLDSVSSVDVSANRPVEIEGQFGWQVQTTADVLSSITVQAVCAG